MLDFVKFEVVTGTRSIYLTPVFQANSKVKDLMVQKGYLYAVWDFENQVWTKNIDRAYELIDACLEEYIREQKVDDKHSLNGVKVLWAQTSSSGIAKKFIEYLKTRDTKFVPLDTRVVFKSDPYIKEMLSTHRLPYDPEDIPTPAYDELMSVIYTKEERQKIEWLVGAGLCGDNGKIQKFGVFYGDPGSGKGTVLDIITMLFEGYTAVFEADALGQKSDNFALEPFKNHPVVALQMDGNLSRIEDNARLNTLIAHEKMTVNEKFKGLYGTKFDTILFIASNSPVKITDSRSGLLRRLIDIEPTGNTLPVKKYNELKSKIPFELSGIAYRCMQLYSNNKHLYDSYRPMPMMARTNDFYDFILEYYDQFCSEKYILLTTAWTWYKKYVDDANVHKKMSRREFASELSSYFKTGPLDEWLNEDGERKHLSSVYRGFKKNKFKNVKSEPVEVVEAVSGNGDLGKASSTAEARSPDLKTDISSISGTDAANSLDDPYADAPDWLKLRDISMDEAAIAKNPLNVYFEAARAQYAVPVSDKNTKDTKPRKEWDKSHIKLSAIDTTKEHYVLCQEIEPNLIFIDCDKVNRKTGEKDLRSNLEVAKGFPQTYVETSRSGKALHLYYIYDGDVNDLSDLFDTNVEIKKLKGKSALRRKLSYSNDYPIAHISSGLPLKEVKSTMIDNYVIENEKHLRSMIKKGLERKVHANTKPSIDYIKYILDKAYDSGMSYSVNDLRSKIMNFAAGSSNNADLCIEIVCDMKFCSADQELEAENKETKVYLEKPIAFFDWEVFPNVCMLCYKVEGGIIGEDGKSEVIKIINPTPNEVSKFFNDFRAIGFNNLEYDNDISYGRILGMSNAELYKLSCGIIANRKDAHFREAKKLSFTDIYDFSNTKQSLKKWEIELGIHHQEFPLRWDQDVPEDKWDLAADYCANDVVATEVVFYHLKADWEARQVLAKVSGLTVNDRTNSHSARIIFGKNRNPQSEFNYPNLADEFPGYEFNKFGIDPERYSIGFDGKSVKTSGKSIFMGDDPSEGGYVYYETGIYKNVALLDVASLHPTSIEVMQLFGPEYTKRFSEVKKARIAIKHKQWDEARVYLAGALVPFLEGVEKLSEDDQQQLSDSLSYALKIVINSIYGCTSASFPNPFKDPRNIDNVVAKRGALFMILLRHKVQDMGYKVVHVKTDSIKIADADDKVIDFVMEFGKQYGYTFEHEATYEKICLVNKSTYISKYDDFGERTKGGRHANQWTATGAEFQHPYIFKTLFSHEPIEFRDYCETKSVSGGAAMYLDRNESMTESLEQELYSLKEELSKATSGKLEIRKKIKAVEEQIESVHNLEFIGRCGLFVPVVSGCDGGYILRIDGDKVGAVSGTKGYRWLESEEVISRGLEDKIDKVYFRKLIDTSIAHIETYGNFDEFVS